MRWHFEALQIWMIQSISQQIIATIQELKFDWTSIDWKWLLIEKIHLNLELLSQPVDWFTFMISYEIFHLIIFVSFVSSYHRWPENIRMFIIYKFFRHPATALEWINLKDTRNEFRYAKDSVRISLLKRQKLIYWIRDRGPLNKQLFLLAAYASFCRNVFSLKIKCFKPNQAMTTHKYK